MTEQRDPFDILGANNPSDPGHFDSYSQHANSVLAAATDDPARHRPSYRRRALYVAIAIAAVLAATAAAWLLSTRNVEHLSIVCYEAAGLDGHRSGLSENATPTVEACEAPFRDGRLVYDRARPGHVPPLTGCVADNNVLTVFPTDDSDICAALGLAAPDPDQPPGVFDDIGKAKQAITAYVQSSKCQPIAEAVSEVRRILDSNHLEKWRVQQNPGRAGQPCASMAYDLPGKTVIVVPIEPAR